MRKFEPLEDRVLIRPHKENLDEKTEGGIIVGGILKKEVQEGTVVAVGPGVYAKESGVFMPTVLAPGDTVVIAYDYGMPIDTDDEKGLKLMREADIMLLVKKISEIAEND